MGSILFRQGGDIYFQIVLPQSPDGLGVENPYPALAAKWKAAYQPVFCIPAAIPVTVASRDSRARSSPARTR